ncbi:MAG: DUF1572 family protein [Chitinophagaceae bacterium]|nr:DUF1572 family protein [Chitinophagaceae bacterium]
MDTLGTAYLQSAIKRVKYYRRLAEDAFAQLNEQDFYFQPNTASNSLAVIIQHMSGNMLSRWTDFLTTDGEKEWRNRDIEFGDQHLSYTQLMAVWSKGWDCFLNALSHLQETDLLATIYIRKEPLLVVDAINRQLAHYPHHVGQIVYIGKMLKGDDWKSLSIQKGKSDEYNAIMAAKA